MNIDFSQSLTLPILYEDEFLVVIDKPSGIFSVMLNEQDSADSLAKKILSIAPEQSDVSNKKEDAGLIQRLDYDTSGCILVAKDRNTWQIMFNDLKIGAIHKTYLAVTENIFTHQEHLETFIGSKGRHSHKVKIIKKSGEARTLKAISDFFPIKTNKELNISLIQAQAPTARRHQIRAHSAYLGYPLLGDTLYGSKRSFLSSEREFFLHAQTLEFIHPISKKNIQLTSDIPKIINEIFK